MAAFLAIILTVASHIKGWLTMVSRRASVLGLIMAVLPCIYLQLTMRKNYRE